MKFSDLGLSSKVLAAVEAAGYETPTPIQAQAIPHVLARKDVLGVAQTGTGKTASFTLPMLSLLESGRPRARMPRTLILEPTRELAAQVEQSFTVYGQNHRLTVALLIGGVSFADQLKKLDRGADVLIATPGRLLDHFERGKLLLNAVDTFVVDEADRMLDMGFIPDIERICKLLPPSRQTVFFSATMPSEIQSLVDQFLRNPERIEVAPPSSTAKTITQGIVASGNKPWEKREVLRNLITEAQELQNAIIFCNRKRDVATLFRSLNKHGFNAGALHGDMDQTSRMATLDKFKSGELSILVASDVAARGLDIPTVSHVFNFDLPTHAEDYVHRIGRTGRAGREGVALSIATRNDTKYLDSIEKLIDEKIAWQGDGSFPERSDEDEESSRSRKGSRNSRRTRSGKKDKDNSPQREARERKESPASSESQEERRPRPRKDRQERHSENSESASRNRSPQGRGRRGRDRDDKQVIGMGDHVPAFLLAPIRPPKRKTKKLESKSAE
ncbi:DEAD/DEAH box helicase [Cohaesibacter gelatinilyticus]|uniref:DEAD-box ATP-dependent RNA helicase RhpA n=1 Tax=Cohaesibacter gelatinilyticus TaxID=372072 RepID=A0A285NEV5_9HYPH|nr:DEAD/DEAH box helicase [Cohaesibacter gelatinilyticus]SNZ07985.1 Superfamily II DNA and RNA helicase [Cohaesibacter gelatinilyticus]